MKIHDVLPDDHKNHFDYLTLLEYRQLVSALRTDVMKVAVTTLWHTGLRGSELCALTREDLLFDENLIRVKTNSRHISEIPMDLELHVELKEFCGRRSMGPQDRIFALPNTRTGALSPKYFNHQLKQTARRLGWDKEVTTYTFRRSFIVNLINERRSP